MAFEQKFQDFILQKQLLAATDRVLVAISGGIDSVVLAHLFRQGKMKFALAHCNFQLRGTESDGDAEFVDALGVQLGVQVFVKRFDTREYAAKHRVSIQLAARELRYQWFEEIRQAERLDAIATGHNLNDSIETALFHFIRGTGLTGLTGIPVRNGAIIRPLLFATRDEILEYATARAIQWREDSSNILDDYTRNAIRQHVVPQMATINEAFFNTAAKTIDHLRMADQNLQFLLQELIGLPDSDGTCRLTKARLTALPEPTAALFDLLQPFGFSADQVQQISECWSQTGTAWQSSTGYRLIMDREELLLAGEPPPPDEIVLASDDLMVRVPGGSRLVLLHDVPEETISTDNQSVVVDKAKLIFPLRLRRWHPGDLFCPLGMNGKHQKVQDFFTNNKLSLLEKEQAWILEDSAGKIVWILGMRLDERFKVDPSSKDILRITWIK